MILRSDSDPIQRGAPVMQRRPALVRWMEQHDCIVLDWDAKQLTVCGWEVTGTPDSHRVYLVIEEIVHSQADARAYLGY